MAILPLIEACLLFMALSLWCALSVSTLHSVRESRNGRISGCCRIVARLFRRLRRSAVR